MTTGRRIKPNNKGFSLVELVVVVLILGVLAGGTAIAISVLYNARVDNAAKRLNSMLDRAREEAMAHITSTTYIDILEESGNVFARVFVMNSAAAEGGVSDMVAEEKLGNTNITFKFTAAKRDAATGSEVTVAGKTRVRIYYNPANGALTGLAQGIRYSDGAGGEASDEAVAAYITSFSLPAADYAGDLYYYTDVKLEGSETQSLIIIPETGRVLKN